MVSSGMVLVEASDQNHKMITDALIATIRLAENFRSLFRLPIFK